MHIRHLIFASIASFACLCASAFRGLGDLILESVDFPAYVASPIESIALDRAVIEAQATPPLLDRFKAFCSRALNHDRYSAGQFDSASVLAVS